MIEARPGFWGCRPKPVQSRTTPMASTEASARSNPSGVRPPIGTQARILALFFFAGAGLGALAIAFFPLPEDINLTAAEITLGFAAVAGAVLYIAADRLPWWAIDVALAMGMMVVSANIYFAGRIRTNDEMFFLWVCFFAFYFMPGRRAALQ